MNTCVTCNRSLRRLRRHVLSHRFFESRQDFVEHILRDIHPPQEIPFDGTRSICHACWHRIDQAVHRDPAPQPAPQPQGAAAVAIPVPGLSRVANTSRRCMIDDCNDLQLRQMPNSIKVYLMSYYHLLIPPLARICQNHLTNIALEDITGRVTRRRFDFSADNYLDIRNMYVLALEQRSQIDFENIHEMTVDDLHFWTGLSHTQFNQLLDQVPSLLRSSRTPRADLGIYLSKIRTGEPSIRLSTVFNKPRRSIDRKIHLTRRCLFNDFVPMHLGLDHITRNEVIERNRILPNHIFGSAASPKAVLICDGTYLFIQKSSNFLFQRNSYSMHKYQNLIKPFMVVCGDGYILDVTGPYDASTSDATIMNQILHNHGGPMEEAPINYFLNQGDVFILDRGFRDSIPLLETYGYDVHVPQSTIRGETQLTTDQANKSRRVTLCRWVVETINGRFKRDFKIFRHRIFNRTLPDTMTDFKIAAALINCFQEPYDDSVYTRQFIDILSNVNEQNQLCDYVLEHNLNRQRVTFIRMRADNQELSDFPRLTHEDLILIAVGTYHLKIARSYCSEHLKLTGVYELEVFRHPEIIEINAENCVLIRCRIHSRHVRSRTYYTYVLHKRENGRNGIAGYYCSCIHGRRTLGCCAHVMSVLYYLGWARHQEWFHHPAAFLDEVILDLENQ